MILQKDLDMALNMMLHLGVVMMIFSKSIKRKAHSIHCLFSPTNGSFCSSMKEHCYRCLKSSHLPSLYFLLLIGNCLSPNDACRGGPFLSFSLTRTDGGLASDLTVKELYVCCSDLDYFWVNQMEGNEYPSNYSNMDAADCIQ